jgi:hypothetical protein
VAGWAMKTLFRASKKSKNILLRICFPLLVCWIIKWMLKDRIGKRSLKKENRNWLPVNALSVALWKKHRKSGKQKNVKSVNSVSAQAAEASGIDFPVSINASESKTNERRLKLLPATGRKKRN